MPSGRKGTAIKSTKDAGKQSRGFTEEEKAAMRERAKEMKVIGSGSDLEAQVLAKIAEMSEPDRTMGRRIHAIIKSSAPSLAPKLWYGMPAYSKDDKIVCHFQPAKKFKTRYATLGFSDRARLDEGDIWPNAFALMRLTPVVEGKIAELVKRASS